MKIEAKPEKLIVLLLSLELVKIGKTFECDPDKFIALLKRSIKYLEGPKGSNKPKIRNKNKKRKRLKAKGNHYEDTYRG